MTDKTFTFTIDQIKEIYRAGISRGHEEECAYQHGSNYSGWTYTNLVETIHDFTNEGKRWTDADYINYDVVESWFK